MLECNRITENSNINEDRDLYKNSWTNNVSSYGIEINKGDVISLDSASINTNGSVVNTIEFIGEDITDDNQPIDNKGTLIMAPYINHTGQNTTKLPLTSMATYTSYDLPPNGAGRFDNHLYVRNRGLGEMNLLNFTDDEYEKLAVINGKFITYLVISISGAGYNIGDKCDVVGSSGTGMKVQITDVLSEGEVQGAVARLKITQVGDNNYPIDQDLDINIIGGFPSGTTGTTATLRILAFNNPNLREKWYNSVDGQRYYPSNIDFTGIGLVDFEGNPPITNVDYENLNPTFDFRQYQIDLEIPVGLNQPNDVAENLTKQMKRPKIYGQQFSNNGFFDYESSKLISPETQDTGQATYKTVIIETPSYKMNTTNFSVSGNPNNTSKMAGARKLFYSNIAYRDPFKLEGLQWTRNSKFATETSSNIIETNAFNTGKEIINNIGDFTNQSVGNLGINLSLMCVLNQASETSLINLNEGDLILSNFYFTEENISNIAGGFKRIERYFGDMSNPLNSLDYNEKLAVVMDIGKYVDSQSVGDLLRDSDDIQQRFRFETGIECTQDFADTMLYSVQQSDDEPRLGTQANFIDGEYVNDGQQLSFLPVKSRYNDSYIIDNNNNYNNYKYTFSSANPLIDQNRMFYVDDSYSLSQVFRQEGFDELIALAKKYDVACVPVWPTEDDSMKVGNTPYIAFISAVTTNTDTSVIYDPQTNENWTIDAENCTYGMPLGYDPSFIRNQAVYMFNPQTTNTPTDGDYNSEENYGQGLFLGASNISIDFNDNFDRFTFSNLSTPMVIGQGTLADYEYGNGILKDASDDPETQVYNLSNVGQYSAVQISDSSGGQYNLDGFNVKQKTNSIVDSLSGLSILKVQLNYKNNVTQTFDTHLSVNNNDIIKNSLFGKLGFTFDDLLPKYGDIQNRSENNQIVSQDYNDAYSKCKPLTLNSYISSSEYQPSSSNILDQPEYGLGYNVGRTAKPSVNSAFLVATNLPQKLDYPFLTVHSSLCKHGTNTIYYGGSKSTSQNLPIVGTIPRYNNEGNFYYGTESSYNFTATKDFVLSDIDTRILLPNGSRPRLNVNSNVVYKITKIINQEPVQLPQSKRNNKKK